MRDNEIIMSLRNSFRKFIEKNFSEEKEIQDIYNKPIDPLELLKEGINVYGGVRKLAREIKYSPSYISLCLHRKKPISKKIINTLKDKLLQKENRINEEVNKKPIKLFTKLHEKDLIREKIRELKEYFIEEIAKSRTDRDYIREELLRKELRELGIVLQEEEIIRKIRESYE